MTPYNIQILQAIVSIISVALAYFLLSEIFKRKTNFKTRINALHQKKSSTGNRILDGRILALFNRVAEWFQNSVFSLKPLTSMGKETNTKLIKAGIRRKNKLLYFFIIKFGILAGFWLLVGILFFTTDFFFYPSQIAIPLVVLVSILSFFIPNLILSHLIKARRKNILLHWDDALDLLVICLESGMSLDLSLRRVTDEISVSAPILAEEFTIMLAEMSIMTNRSTAYANLAERTGNPVIKAVTIAFTQAEKQGSSIARSIRVISLATRDDKISLVKQKAASLGPKLTLPMMIFFLPATFVIIIAPIALGFI